MIQKLQTYLTNYWRKWLNRNHTPYGLFPNRNKPPQRIRSRYGSRMWMTLIVFGAVYIFAVIIFLPALKDGGLSWERFEGLVDNLGTEIVGAAITFFIFELILERRDQERDMLRAYRQLRSRANDTAVSAADELREEGILLDGSLQGAYLQAANLQGANLARANMQEVELAFAKLQKANMDEAFLQGAYLPVAKLQKAYLGHADLSEATLSRAKLQNSDLREANLVRTRLDEADLTGANLVKANLHRAVLEKTVLKNVTLINANLSDATLWRADLQHSTLRSANLQGSSLWEADLQGATLEDAHLQGADLSEADLRGAILGVGLHAAKFDEMTTLPDRSSWTADTDLTRFTDPNHPKFWRSNDPYSPTYQNNSE